MLNILQSHSKKLINAGRLIYANIADDPSYFVLQVVRKFKNTPLKHAIKVLLWLPFSEGSREAIASLLADDKTRLLETVSTWLERPGEDTHEGNLLANICIAMFQWEAAEKILGLLEDSMSARRGKARLAWQLGELRPAIETLSRNGPSRQLDHYESELEVLSGWRPKVRDGQLRISEDRKPTVLYFATNSLPYTGSGYAQRTHSVLKSLQDKGWPVVAVTRGNYPASIGNVFAPASDKIDSITYDRILPFPAKHDLRGRLQQQTSELLKIVEESRPSILHTTTDFTNALSIRAVSKATGIPWIYEVRGQLADTWASTRPDSAQNSERYMLFQAREAEAAQAADHVVTLGEHMKLNLIAAGVSEEKITVLPNGIGDKFIELPIPGHSARTELSLEPEAFYIGTVSSLVPYEGLDVLLRAVALIAPSQPSLRVLIVGDGTELGHLRSLATDLGIINICQFPGRVPREIAHLYHASLDAFVVPRHDLAVTRSVTPLKPVEALASGVPVLASDLPALRELIINGESGHLIPAGDAQAWATAIALLISDPDVAERMGRNGRKLVLEARTWKGNAQRLVDIYEQAISQAT